MTTLCCGEGDYLASQESILTQVGMTVDTEVFNDLPEMEAHNALLSSWNERKQNYDALFKVDADTVLRHPTVLKEMTEFLVSSGAAALQAWLNDFYTDTLIYGLNCYDPRKNTFNLSDNRLFCDRSIVHRGQVMYGDDMPPSVRVAGDHCHRATLVQSFHYGLHRGLKGRSPGLVADAHRKHPHPNRAMALEGFSAASSFAKKDFDYRSPDFASAFETAVSRITP